MLSLLATIFAVHVATGYDVLKITHLMTLRLRLRLRTTAFYVPCERTVVQPCSGQTLITKHAWQCAMQKNKLQSTQETGPHNKSLGFNNNILYIINCKTFSFFNIRSFCYTLKPKRFIIWRERERNNDTERKQYWWQLTWGVLIISWKQYR
jgi:hypothetical protein